MTTLFTSLGVLKLDMLNMHASTPHQRGGVRGFVWAFHVRQPYYMNALPYVHSFFCALLCVFCCPWRLTCAGPGMITIAKCSTLHVDSEAMYLILASFTH